MHLCVPPSCWACRRAFERATMCADARENFGATEGVEPHWGRRGKQNLSEAEGNLRSSCARHFKARPRTGKAKRVEGKRAKRADRTRPMGKRAPPYCAYQHWGQAEGKRQNTTSTNHHPTLVSIHPSFIHSTKCPPILYSQNIKENF